MIILGYGGARAAPCRERFRLRGALDRATWAAMKATVPEVSKGRAKPAIGVRRAEEIAQAREVTGARPSSWSRLVEFCEQQCVARHGETAFAEAFPYGILPETRAEELGFDSFDLVEIATFAEAIFKVTRLINLEEVWDRTVTIGNIAEYLDTAIAEQYYHAVDRAGLIRALAKMDDVPVDELTSLLNHYKATKGETTAHETTDRATAEPRQVRLKWETNRLADEDPATFAARAGYEHRGQIHGEDRGLSLKLSNWLRTHDWPKDVRFVPTKPQWIEGQIEAATRGGRLLRAPRSEEAKLHDAARYRGLKKADIC